MLIIVGTILSLIASVLTYWGIGLFNLPWFYLFLLIPFAITFFVIFLNIYWAIVLISILPYRNKEFVGKVNKWNLFHIRLTASFCLMLRGLIIKRKGFKNIPKQPSLILFNHISDYDPWVLYKLLHGRYAMVGKIALRSIPMVRCMASATGTLFVDSNNPDKNREMVDEAVKYISEKGTSVCIAPEGTRNFSGQLSPFKHGGFNIATRSNCPIVFIGFKDMQKAVVKRKSWLLKIHVEVFDVIQPEEYQGMSAGEVAELCETKYRKYLGE